MAKKDLRAQMDAARAAAAYIGAAQEDLAAPERGISLRAARRDRPRRTARRRRPRRSRTHEVRSASLDVTQAAAMPDFFAEDYTEEPRCEAIPSVSYGIASVLAASDAAGTAEAADAAGMVEAADTAGMVEVAGAAGTAEIAGAAGTTETADAAAAAVEDADAPSRAAGASRAAARTRKPRKKSVEAEPPVQAGEGTSGRMTAQVRVPMTAEQREHADLLASVLKITRAEVMRQALDEYWAEPQVRPSGGSRGREALTKAHEVKPLALD